MKTATFKGMGFLTHRQESYYYPELRTTDGEHHDLREVISKLVPKGFQGYVDVTITIAPCTMPPTVFEPIELPKPKITFVSSEDEATEDNVED